MKVSAISALVGLAAIVGAGVLGAQQQVTVARLANLEGSVLVSQNDAMIAAASEQRLPVGARVVTMSGAKVVIRYDNGCDVALNENQRFVVRVGECPVLLAEVVSLGPAPATAAAITSDQLFGIAGVVAVSYGAYEFFRNKPVSSN